MMRRPNDNTSVPSAKTAKTASSSALLWAKRRWMIALAACLVAAVLLRPFNWIWLASAAVCLVIALDAHERLRAAIGEPCRWRDVFDLEVDFAAWFNNGNSRKRGSK